MKKLPKRPRTFGRKKAKPYQHKKQEPHNQDTITFGELFPPQFFEWYEQNYDENGVYVGERILGLHG